MAKFPSFFSKKRSPNQCKTDRSNEICTENRHEIGHFLPIVLQRNLPRKIPRFSREIGPLLTRIWLWKSREIWLFPMIYQKPVVHGVFFWGGVGGGEVFLSFFLSFILHNVCKKLALDQLDLHWRTLRSELLNVQTIFMTQSDYWKLVLIVFFCAEIFDPFDCKLDVALLWFHHHRKSQMISR